MTRSESNKSEVLQCALRQTDRQREIELYRPCHSCNFDWLKIKIIIFPELTTRENYNIIIFLELIIFNPFFRILNIEHFPAFFRIDFTTHPFGKILKSLVNFYSVITVCVICRAADLQIVST